MPVNNKVMGVLQVYIYSIVGNSKPAAKPEQRTAYPGLLSQEQRPDVLDLHLRDG